MAELYDHLTREIHATNRRVVRAVEELADAQLAWQPGGTTPSIAFNLWHSARWADTGVAAIGGQAQLWELGGYAGRWRLDQGPLGEAQTGTGLTDDQAAGLMLPSKEVLVEYATAVFASQHELLARLTPEQLVADVTAADGNQYVVQGLITTLLMHTGRHLGMIEALKGLQGLRGTATR